MFLVVAIFLAVLVASRFQNCSVNKINFIIFDNQHENVASLTPEQLAEYIHYCGAHVSITASTWVVHYDGLFQHRSWKFPYAMPRTTEPNK